MDKKLAYICICCCCCLVARLSCVQLFATPWTIPHQTPLSMGFPSQEYWSGLPFPSSGYLPDPRIEPVSPSWHADSLPLSHLRSPYMCMSEWVKSLSHVRLSVSPWTVACTRLLCPWDFLGKNTGVGCHFLLQGIFLTQGSNPGLLHCRQTLYHLSHQGSC